MNYVFAWFSAPRNATEGVPYRTRTVELVTLVWLAILSPCALAAAAATETRAALVVATDNYRAEFRAGALVSLTAADGHVYVRPGKDGHGLGIHCADGEFWAGSGRGPATLEASRLVEHHFSSFAGLPDGQAEASFRLDGRSGDLVVSQRCSSEAAGVWGVSWSIGAIPLAHSIIVPGRSGVRLTATTPGRRHEFGYPMGWEAQLLIVEGPEGGFYVWADDASGRYKRLLVERGADGWRIELTTTNNAPFDGKTTCKSVTWHVNTYRGDWRVPAHRYRDWAVANFQPVPLEQQRPTWVSGIRAMVIMGLDRKTLEALPRRLDPQQTVLYIPTWRSAGYDRNYPAYDQPLEGLASFVDRAHVLGFRVMLHVNYFGVDPLHAAYAQFKQFQCRDPRGDHQRLWWLWRRAEPEIRFAYINPAARAWRDYFTAAMTHLCHQYHIDALHLDQSMALFNDNNGRIDGMTMIEGNIALHRQLRAALPEVALSGEGLNEITYRFESFAQRHVWGLNHTERTWDRRYLAAAHPISSYLFRSFVIINGYLGCAAPTDGQFYAAWNEAYQHWGVIPTLRPALSEIDHPQGFSRQFYDEVAFWQQRRLAIDMESAWPGDVAFPFRTAAGRRAVHLADGRFQCQGTLISRTVTGANRLEASGNIPNWRAFDDRQIFGLARTRWYPYFDEPRPRDVFHVAALPADITADAVVDRGDTAMVRTSSEKTVVADLVELLDNATVGSRPFEGTPYKSVGPFVAPDGGQFLRASSSSLSAHPPWKKIGDEPEGSTPGHAHTGVAYARYRIKLPAGGRLRFTSDVVLARDAVGKPGADGVTFGCEVGDGQQTLRTSLHQETAHARLLELDLSLLAGRQVTVELTVHPGPDRAPSFDWARWGRPRIEREVQLSGELVVAGHTAWKMAIGRRGALAIEPVPAGQRVQATMPGTVFFLDRQPAQVELPVDLAGQKRYEVLLGDGSAPVQAQSFLGVRPARSTVGQVARAGLFAHPPDHGRALVFFPMVLPNRPQSFQTWIGIRDGAKSTGVTFRVEVNGRTAAERHMLPGKWEAVAVDLAPWQGKPVVLALITDSEGAYDCDWAHWGEPRIVPK